MLHNSLVAKPEENSFGAQVNTMNWFYFFSGMQPPKSKPFAWEGGEGHWPEPGRVSGVSGMGGRSIMSVHEMKSDSCHLEKYERWYCPLSTLIPPSPHPHILLNQIDIYIHVDSWTLRFSGTQKIDHIRRVKFSATVQNIWQTEQEALGTCSDTPTSN